MKKYIGLEDMSHSNCASVLRVIQRHGEISRKQIADVTGLSWGGMTKIVNKLFEHEYIVEEKGGIPGGNGRTPGVIHINREKHFVVGADIHHTGLRACVMDLSGGIKRKYREENSFQDKEELLKNILRFFQRIFDDFGNMQIQAAGIAMQGRIDAENGISIHFPKCKNWNHVPVIRILKERFPVEAYLEHDPDCMLFFELENTDVENLVLLRIDQSIGMAVSLNGTILRGKGILELPHSIVIPGGKPCRCGLRGCLEAYVAPCVKNGEINRKAIEELIVPLAVTIYNMTCIFNADTVILTGELIKYRSLFEDRLLLELQKMPGEKKAKIQFTEDAKTAVKGAAMIAVRRAVDSIKL